MNSLYATPDQDAMLSGEYVRQMEMAKADARRLRREAVRDCDYGVGSLGRSARRFQAALTRHAAWRASPVAHAHD
jgi:hypothetical protein